MFNFNFNGMGGQPGMGGGGPKKEVDTNKFYEILGVEKDADQRAIKKAFRKAARIHHPDKGGDAEKFKEVNKAYEILGDPEKRELYNQYGEEGVENGGAGMGGATDIFDMLYRRQGGGGGRQKTKGEDCVFKLGVQLQDMYKGIKKNLRLTRNLICSECAGQGGTGVSTCGDCKGQGVRLTIRQIAPGMIQQMQSRCGSCNATGKIVQEKCTVCKGKKTVKDKKTLEVYVEKGMRNGQKVIFRGEADQAPDTIPGNVVVILEQKVHPFFKREGNHLFMRKTISLSEALCGFSFNIKTLDDRTLKISTEPGEVLKPGAFKYISEEGMPHHKAPSLQGNLYIEFKVEFPDTLSLNQVKQLRKTLPKPENMDEEDDESVEQCNMHNVDDIAAERKRHQQEEANRRRRGGEAYDEDDDEGAQRHECRSA